MHSQYVNGHVMNSQFANRETMKCNSETSFSIESARYIAPNTCAPINACVLREPAISFSQIQSERTHSSDDRSEADSGFGRMSHPSPKSTLTGSGNTATHAPFDDEKKVLVFNSDVSDKEENKVSTDKKSEKKRNIRKNSPKNENAESDGNGNGNKSGRDRFTSKEWNRSRMSDSESCDKGSKGQQDQFASKERPRRLRSSSKRRTFSNFQNAPEKDAANVLWDYGAEVVDSLSRLTKP